MKKILTLLALAWATTFVACDNEPQKPVIEEPKDETAPVITLNSPTAADFHQDNVLVTASATDDKKVVSMEIYFDNDLVHSVDENEISHEIDTHEFEDGDHTLKIVAKDSTGNESEIEQTIKLLNKLITLEFLVNNPQEGHEHYYYLVDDAGGIASEPVKVETGMEQIIFETPANHTIGKKYFLAALQHVPANEFFPSNNFLGLIDGYGEGTYSVRVGYVNGENIVSDGVHTLNLSGFPDPLLTTFHSKHFGQLDMYVSNAITIPLKTDGTEAYVAVRPDLGAAPVYKMFSDLEIGGATTITPDDFTPMNGVSIPASEGAVNSYSFVTGMETAGDYMNNKFIWFHFPWAHTEIIHEFQMYYPGNEFAEYYSAMFESVDDHYNSYLHFGQTPPTAFKTLNASVTSLTFNEEAISLQTTGEFDYIQVGGGLNQAPSEIDAFLNWSIVTRKPANNMIKLPAIPQSLIDEYSLPGPSEWNPQVSVYLSDYSGLEGYDEYFDATFADPAALLNYNLWGAHSRELLTRGETFETTTGGRVKPSTISKQDVLKQLAPFGKR